MLKKLKITTYVFILYLFGLTLITVSPVFAEDNEAFIQCQQIKPQGQFQPMKQKKNCFRDLAGPRDSAAFIQCTQIKPQGQFQLMKEKKNCFRDLALALEAGSMSLDTMDTHGMNPPDSLAAPQVEAEGRNFCDKTLDEMDVSTFREACAEEGSPGYQRNIKDPDYGRACGLSGKMIHPTYVEADINDIDRCADSADMGPRYANQACKTALKKLRQHATDVMQPRGSAAPKIEGHCSRGCGCGGNIESYRTVEGYTKWMFLSCKKGTLVPVVAVADLNRSWAVARDACGF